MDMLNTNNNQLYGHVESMPFHETMQKIIMATLGVFKLALNTPEPALLSIYSMDFIHIACCPLDNVQRRVF